MISVESIKRGFPTEENWVAFPGVLFSLVSLRTQFPNELSVNRPGLEHWFLLIRNSSLNENLSRYSRLKYLALSDINFRRYTIISVRSQGMMNRKLNRCGVYNRSDCADILNNLSWVSAEYHWAGYGVINSMESPILLFDSNFFGHLDRNWCSAFISFLSSGFLTISISYKPFSLGKIAFRLCDLLED
jgi:hypothetical protein